MQTSHKKGLEPVCVKHWMANGIKWGRLEDLAKSWDKKPKWSYDHRDRT